MQYKEYENWGIKACKGDEVGKWLIEWATLDEPLGEEEHQETWSAQEKESEMQHSGQRYSLQIPDKGSATETRDLSSSRFHYEKFYIYNKWKHCYHQVVHNPTYLLGH